MFAEDGAFEMPILESLGFPGRYEGRQQVEEFFKFVKDLYPKLDFHDWNVVCETPKVVVAEFEFTTPQDGGDSSALCRTAGSRECKIALGRESLNLVELGLAIIPMDWRVTRYQRSLRTEE